MGNYINTPATHADRTNKAHVIINTPEAKASVVQAEEVNDKRLGIAGEDQYLLCVVKNGAFDAALVVESERDIDDVLDPRDHRPMTFLLVDKSWAQHAANMV